MTPLMAMYLALGLLVLAGAALPVAFAYDIVKRPIHTWHWLLSPLLGSLTFVHAPGAWSLGFTQHRYDLLTTTLFLQAWTFALFSGLVVLLLGIARRLRPEADIVPVPQTGLLVITVVWAVVLTPAGLVSPLTTGFGAMAGLVVVYLLLYGVRGGDRIATARRTGAALVTLATLAVALPAALLLLERWIDLPPNPTWLSTPRPVTWLPLLVLPLGAVVVVVRLGAPPAPLVLLMAAPATAVYGVRLAFALYAAMFLLPRDLPVPNPDAILQVRHGISGALFRGGEWLILQPRHQHAADTDACQLSKTMAVDRGLRLFVFDDPSGSPVRVLRDERGWYLGENGPIADEAIVAAVRTAPHHILSVVRSPHATFQQVLDVCTTRRDLFCELDPDTSHCAGTPAE